MSCTGCSIPEDKTQEDIKQVMEETFENPVVDDSEGCPFRMADGRLFTDYRPRCHVQGDLYKMVGGDLQHPFSAYNARMYLQRNAADIMKQNQKVSGCMPCKRPFNSPGTEMPNEYVVRCNTVSCTRTATNELEAVGDRREYFSLPQ